MGLDNFPWYLVSQAMDRQRQNQQDMNQNIAGLGQALGGSLATIGQSIAAQKHEQTLNQLVQAMRTQGAPQQGPQMPGTENPVSGMGAPAQDNTALIRSLEMQYAPDEAIKAMMPQKAEWAVAPGMFSKGGHPLAFDKFGGTFKESPLEAMSSSKMNSNVAWANATPQQQETAKGLYEGRIRPSDISWRERSLYTSLANEYAINNKLKPFVSYSGEVKAGMAKSLSSGKLGLNALSLNTALGHAASAMDAYDEIGNTDVNLLNVPINKLRESTNNAKITALEETLTALQGEAANIFKSSGATDQEIKKWEDSFSPNLTPAQAQAAISTFADLADSRLKAMEYQQTDVMRNSPLDRTLASPHSREVFQKVREPLGAKMRNFSSVAAAEAAKLPKGTKISINGRSATVQ